MPAASPVFQNSANYEKILKEYYIKDKVQNLTYKDRPLFGMLEKEYVSGKLLPLPVFYSNPQGTSNDFSVALSNQFPSSSTAFYLSAKSKYSIASVTGRVMMESRDNQGAFLDAMTAEIDNSILEQSNQIHVDLYGKGNAVLATVVLITPVSGNTYTLTLGNSFQSVYFNVNQRLVLSTTDVVTVSGTSQAGLVVRVNRNTGSIDITFDAPLNPSFPTGTPVLDYLGREGDFKIQPTGNFPINGLGAWIPTSDPGSNPFLGVDRSVDPQRLAGVRLAIPGAPVKEAFEELVQRVIVNQGNPDVIFANPEDVINLKKSLWPNVRYEDRNLRDTADVSFRAIELQSSKRPVAVIQDYACPQGTAWALQLNTWKLYCWGDLVNMVNDDGITRLRLSNDDGVQVRIRTFCEMGCRAPGFNGVVTF